MYLGRVFLERQTFAHQTRYPKLYEERGAAIKAIYCQIAQLDRDFATFTSPFSSNEQYKDAGNNFIEKFNDAMHFFEDNRLNFSDPVATTIRTALETLKKGFYAMEDFRSPPADIPGDPQGRKRAKEAQMQFGTIRKSLEQEFRELLDPPSPFVKLWTKIFRPRCN